MRVLMFATGPFALPTLEALYAAGFQVAALVTQPQRPGVAASGGPALRALAARQGTPIEEPWQVNAPEVYRTLAAYRPDVLVVADYGQILGPELLAMAPLGGVNLHGSLLPRYRGAAPINWAIYHGEEQTGVTVIHMTPAIDAGPILAQAATAIGPDETAPQLEARLAQLGAPLVVETLRQLERGEVHARPQDPALATPARRLRKADGQVDWSRPARAIYNQVRALEPWPRTYTWWHRPGGRPLRLILTAVRPVEGKLPVVPPGTVVQAGPDGLSISTGGGTLCLHAVQPEGKRVLEVSDFLRGYPVRVGERFGPEAPALPPHS